MESKVAYQKFRRKVCAVIDTSQVLLVILDSHPFLRQWSKEKKALKKATDPYLGIV